MKLSWVSFFENTSKTFKLSLILVRVLSSNLKLSNIVDCEPQTYFRSSLVAIREWRDDGRQFVFLRRLLMLFLISFFFSWKVNFQATIPSMLVLTGAILSNFVKIITTKTSFLRPAQLTLLSCGRKRRGEGEKGRGGSSNPPAFSPPPPPTSPFNVCHAGYSL